MTRHLPPYHQSSSTSTPSTSSPVYLYKDLQRTKHGAAMYRTVFLAVLMMITLGSVSGGGQEFGALHALFVSFGPSNLNWSSLNYCEWDGVGCNEDGLVESISLNDKNLTGSLSASITSLSYLKFLDISYNRLTGPFPTLHELRSLSMVWAQNNYFTSFPDDFFNSGLTALTFVNISHNQFSRWHISGHSGELLNLYAINAGISGTLDVFTEINFPRLINLDLANNHIMGTVPFEMTKLPYLRLLDLSRNHLSGRLPKFGPKVVVRVYGNQDLDTDSAPSPTQTQTQTQTHTPTQTQTQTHSHVPVILIVSGCVGGLLLVLAIVTGLYAYLHVKKEEDPEGSFGDSLEKFSVDTLSRATGGFSASNLLGEGGFSKVYKGVLENSTEIAVKSIEGSVGDDFKAEITLLCGLRHRNLVALLGYCWEENEKLLVYEYMPRGTLGRHLFHWQQENLRPLDWPTRLRIALDVANGVNYLHTASREALVHRDLKPSNILLGDDMEAKIADFGLVHPIPKGKSSTSMPLAGTQGYWPYESIMDRKVSPRGDVYTFGVILMELISGRKSIIENLHNAERFLPTWFADRLNIKDENGKIIQLVDVSRLSAIVDPPILSDDTLSTIAVVAELALHCVHPNHHRRPTMAYVFGELTRLVEGWEPPEPEVSPFDRVEGEALTLSQIFREINETDLDASSSSGLVTGRSFH